MVDIKIFLPRYLVEADNSTDLNNYLSIFQPTLDWLNDEITDVIKIVDVDACPPAILPYLASQLNYAFDFTATVASQRKIIKGLIERYRRKGSNWSFIDMLKRIDLDATLYNTINKIMVLSYQGVLSDTGYFEDGWYISEGSLDLIFTQEMSEALYNLYKTEEAKIHPAGFIIWLNQEQQFYCIVSISQNSEFQVTYCTDFGPEPPRLSESFGLSDTGYLSRIPTNTTAEVNPTLAHSGLFFVRDAGSEYWDAGIDFSMTSPEWYLWKREVEIVQTA